MDYQARHQCFFGHGDKVAVLYDGDEPQRSCFVFRLNEGAAGADEVA
jgi:hypothetical protein